MYKHVECGSHLQSRPMKSIYCLIYVFNKMMFMELCYHCEVTDPYTHTRTDRHVTKPIFLITHTYTHTNKHTHVRYLFQSRHTHTNADVICSRCPECKLVYVFMYTKQRWDRWENLCICMFKHLFYHDETLRLENCPLMSYARRNSYSNV